MTDSFVSGFSRFIFLSMATVSLENFGKALEKQIKSDIRQVKFCASLALNDLARKIKAESVPKSFEKSFTVRNKQFPQRLQYDKAKPDRLSVTLTFPHEQMVPHAEGGEKTPSRSKLLAVPADDLKEKSFRGPKGAVKKSYKPATLLQYADTHPTRRKGEKSSGAKAFVQTSKSGHKFIAKRKSKRSNEFDVLYSLNPLSKIKKDWDFRRVVVESRDKFLADFLDKRIKDAIAKKRL